jgi:ACS family tartrate transporter-like MFS transporter
MNHPTRQPLSSPAAVPQPSAGAPLLTAAEQRAVVTKVTARLIPLLFLCYIIAYLDRINVGFAKLHLREALGVDPTVFSSVYGLGAGLFFIGYFLFEVPSNLILERVGARVWIARIMIVWGLVSMAFMFTKGVTMFYVMRFLLGAAEAGFFPGVILYLTYWYPAKERARTVALFAVGGVSAGVIGSPISGALLGLNGVGGLAGWQWLFLLEALPAVLMGLVVLFLLPNGPPQARWLSDREKEWIQSRLSEEASRADAAQPHRLKDVFTSPLVWLFCLIYFLLNVGGYGYEMWLPTIVKGFSGQSDAVVGLINAIPYLIAGVVMLLYGQHSDRKSERRGHVAFAAISAAAGFALAAASRNPWMAMAGLTIAFAGLKSTLGPFWALSTAFLSGTAAAGGIALINSVGNLGGFFGPYLVGIIKDATGSDMAALLLLGGALLGMGLAALAVPQTRRAPQDAI